MVKYVKKIIASGDTLQSIAQHHLGDSNRWRELAKFNDLRYPYIVDTVAEKLTNPTHLVTTGDTIMFRSNEDSDGELIANLKNSSAYDQEEIYALTLGKDLNVLPQPRNIGSPGWDAEILEMKDNNKGDLATLRGIENLKQSLLTRILTPVGSYLNHPRYGSYVSEYLGKKNTEENATLLVVELERAIRTDGRVRAVEKVGYNIYDNEIDVAFKVTSIAVEEAFLLALTARENGDIFLNDNFVNNIR
ncbi:baseplate assembly protein [Bacillus phage Phrodo]|uniref:baseplate protein n=1 Tax=Bacillus phage Phrodo TaxID=1805953 RepID=UPI0007A76AD6|nr:baseplate protein [Bacillus phage Phrodo]AMW62141.1 baseplate assembly protein [Bacillus phage Phrodo]UGO48912.1 baseplate assembly protein [Bacillus phage vB_BanH_JarJar]UGO50403.1 baseplate assembly protein [Bacillus phage vB_BanH_RonSwanson]